VSVAVSAAQAAAQAAVAARDLAHRYSARRGLEPVSFEIEAPLVASVTGPNGSGKSTLLRIVAGLLRPNRGACVLRCGGREIAPGGRRERVGLAAPDLAFYEELTVGENLVFAAEARGLADPRGRVRESLERVGLWVRAGDRADALSSGMRQRLRLAFALLHRPPVLLLDEPGSHLDDEGRAMVARLVGEHRAHGLVLIATNEEREWKLADRKIELRGRGLGDPA
jgi:heme exporter protein A